MPYYFSCLIARIFTDQSGLYQTAFVIISPVEYAEKTSHVRVSYWNIVTSEGNGKLATFICVCEIMLSVYLSFQTVVLNDSETEQKCKIGFRTYIIFSLHHT
jgi:hypothetical protein